MCSRDDDPTQHDIHHLSQSCADNCREFHICVTHCQRWCRNGRTQRWKRNPERYSIPVKFGLYDYARIVNGISYDVYCVEHDAHDCTIGR